MLPQRLGHQENEAEGILEYRGHDSSLYTVAVMRIPLACEEIHQQDHDLRDPSQSAGHMYEDAHSEDWLSLGSA